MNGLVDTDTFTRIDTDRFTGQPRRRWIEYADGVMEPVRREGNLNRKYHGNKRSLDWWTVDKPVDWNPRDEGKRVSLHHDYGKRDKPEGPDGAGADSGKAAGPPPASTRPKPKSKSTLNQGAGGFWEYEARREAEAKAQPRSGPTPAPGAGRTPGSPSGNSEEAHDAAASAGALGGMVQSKGQHGKGKVTGSDERINSFKDKYESADFNRKNELAEEFKKDIDDLKTAAKQATGKERKKLLRRADQWKGALKVITDKKVRPGAPLMLFNSPLFQRLLENHFTDPRVPDKT